MIDLAESGRSGGYVRSVIGGLVRDHVPADLEGKLERSRLDLLAFFRAIDQPRSDAPVAR